ncbi:hypothetical protein RFI_03449 [Reticulomyxa filosa]|uniref:Viral A-type inclusion protein n=1 Tax=Reticulomyxa filosa TaxID=46433 RepID=X6P6B2_RETFI|nr:hypothetical protein RFI_03449 [Reticulomyxa filosa]|eukprot:ETO33653.1 hypothetical protein RFI_03449 [Reticulomyxa filosa]
MTTQKLVGSKFSVDVTKTVSNWIIFSKTVKAKNIISITRLYVENGVICAWMDDNQGFPVEQLKVKECVALLGWVFFFFFFVMVFNQTFNVPVETINLLGLHFVLSVFNTLEWEREGVRIQNKTKQNSEAWPSSYPLFVGNKLGYEKRMNTAKRLANAEKAIVQHNTQYTDLMEKVSKIEQNDKKQICHLKEQNNYQMVQIEVLTKDSEKQIEKMLSLKEGYEQQITNLREEKQQLQTQVNSMVKRHEQFATEHGIQKNELHKCQHKIKQLESDFQVQKTQLENAKIKLHEYVLLTEKNRTSLSSLHLEKDSAINELEQYRQQSNEFKEYYFVLLFFFFYYYFF